MDEIIGESCYLKKWLFGGEELIEVSSSLGGLGEIILGKGSSGEKGSYFLVEGLSGRKTPP